MTADSTHQAPAAPPAPPRPADCPRWCQSDHGKSEGHFGESWDAEESARHVDGPLRFRPFKAARDSGVSRHLSKPLVLLIAGEDSPGYDCAAFLPPENAAVVARLIESLAKATPAGHRKIAAALRQAASTATEEKDDPS